MTWLFLLAAGLIAQDPVAVDPRHYTVELDNSRVRVLRVRYQPDEGSPMHEHSAGVRIFITDIRNRFSAPDGSTNEVSRRAGEIIWAEAVRHGNVNIGGTPVEIIELELKGAPKRPARAETTASPVVLENELVRVLRAGAGDEIASGRDRVVVSGGRVSWEAAGSDSAHASGSVVVELK